MRPNWDQTFANIAIEVSKRSTCLRMQVGAVLVKDNRIISIGYNGSVSNSIHCEDYFYKLWEKEYQEYSTFNSFLESQIFYDLHYTWSSIHEIHAEQNAILFAAKKGISTDNSILYITHSPCKYCAKTVATSGIKEVKFIELYDRDDTRDFLSEADVVCTQFHI